MNFPVNIPEYQVSQLNRAMKEVIESNFDYVRIRGEISEVKIATRGQYYLTLKDNDSILSGVIWDQKIKFLNRNPFRKLCLSLHQISLLFRFKLC